MPRPHDDIDINDWVSAPEDMPSFAVSDRDEDTIPPKPVAKWTREEVFAYRAALQNLGLPDVESVIARDCGAEWSRAPMLLVRQAGG